ncbi:hypothetical protein GPJ56_009469 [Histomonas meleagridis]|nr:hypothetical protein GPJ56_009469 [Histomonas meleagridis]
MIKNAPFNQSQETRLRITHGDHMVSQITEGFINFKLRITVQLSKAISSSNLQDPENLTKIFIGFKSSNQLLDQLQIMSNNISTGYQQNECCREGYCYSTIKPYAEKKTRKYTHSLYENVSEYSQSVCGTYVDLNTIADGNKHDIEFEMNLPFEDILALQAFDLYPNRLVGDIELKFYVKQNGLIWCQVDPRKIKEVKEFLEDSSINATFNNLPLFTHGFTQIGNSANITTTFKCDTETNHTIDTATENVSLYCTGLTVLSCKSNIQCERSRGGYVFDGLDSNGQNIPIQIKGQPIYTQANDTYYNVDDAGNHPPPPQLFICRDTYFTLDLHNGLKYYVNNVIA